MALQLKKLTLAEIRSKKSIILRNLHSLLNELERATTVPEDEIWTDSTEVEWIDDTFFMANGVFDKLDDLTSKIFKSRRK